MLLQVLLGFLLREFLRLAVVPGRVGAMADLDDLVPVPVPATPVPVVVVPALGVCRSLDPKKAEHSGGSTADGQSERLTAGPGFTRDGLRQLIEPSVVHAYLFLLAA
jgi:hypothetical protein